MRRTRMSRDPPRDTVKRGSPASVALKFLAQSASSGNFAGPLAFFQVVTCQKEKRASDSHHQPARQSGKRGKPPTSAPF